MFPAQALDGFSCQEDEVRASYKHRHLKAAFANVAQKDPWSAKVGAGRVKLAAAEAAGRIPRQQPTTRPALHPPALQVCISSRGVLKVTHMLTLATGALVAPPLEAPPLLGTFTSQGAGAPQSTCVVQFVILPHDAEDGDGGMLGPDEEGMAI